MVEGYQKVSKVYDFLMKSSKLTAAQRKEEQGEFVDSVGELVELCEKQGYIERYYIDSPKDKVDVTLQDMQRYTKNLIENETNLSALVEQAIKNNMEEDEASRENNSDEIVFDDDASMIQDKDYDDYNEFLDAEREEDYYEEEDEE